MAGQGGKQPKVSAQWLLMARRNFLTLQRLIPQGQSPALLAPLSPLPTKLQAFISRMGVKGWVPFNDFALIWYPIGGWGYSWAKVTMLEMKESIKNPFIFWKRKTSDRLYFFCIFFAVMMYIFPPVSTSCDARPVNLQYIYGRIYKS